MGLLNAMRIIPQTSSGGVVVRRSPEGVEVALIQKALKDGRRIWGLPKGWVEPGESLKAAALREVMEETGLKGDIVSKLGEISYEFYSREDRAHITKTVHFFMMNYVRGNMADHDEEVFDAAWFSPEKAVSAVHFESEREILRKAIQHLGSG